MDVPVESDPGREEMIQIIVGQMDKRGPFIDVPLAEQIVDAMIEATGGTDHIISSDGIAGKWTMQHPITERFSGDLFDCPMVERATQLSTQGAFGPGLHRLYVGEFGIVTWEEK